MVIKRIFLVTLLVFFISLSSALSNELSKDSNSNNERVPSIVAPNFPGKVSSDFKLCCNIIYDDSFIYLLRESKTSNWKENVSDRKFFLEKFDKSINYVNSIELKLPESVNHIDFNPVKIDLLNDRLVVFGTYFDENVSKFISTYTLFDELGNVVRHLKVGNLNKPDFENFSNSFQNISFKENGEEYALYSQITSPEREQKQVMKLTLFDSNLDNIWEKEIVYPYEYLEYKISNIVLSRKDLVFFVVKTEPKYIYMDPEYKLAFYDQGKDKLSTYNFELENLQIKDIKLQTSPDNDYYYLFGYYNKEATPQDVDGMFYYVFDMDNKLINQGMDDFADEMYDGLKNTALTVPEEKLTNLNLKNIIVTENNEVLFVSEIGYKEFINFNFSSGSVQTDKVIHSNEIIVSKFSPAGEQVWSQVIAKQQENPESNDMTGHFNYSNNGYLYFVYNDHPKNRDVKDPKKIKLATNNLVTNIVAMNIEDGSYSKNQIENIDEQKTINNIKPNYAVKMDDYNFLVVGDRKEKLQLAMMKHE